MDYFNNIDDTDLYSTSYTPGDFDAHPFLDQASATEETHGTFADGWSMGVQPDHAVGWPSSLEVEASFGKHSCSLTIRGSPMNPQRQQLRPPHTTPKPTATGRCHSLSITGP